MSWKTKQYLGMGLIAISLFLVWTLDAATYNKISAMREAISEREATIEERQKVLASIKNFQKEYESRSADIQRFAALLPPKKSTAELVSSLEAMAAQSGLTITNLSTSDPTATDSPYQELGIVIDAQGSYSALTGFLQSAEKNLRIMDMQTIEVAADARQASVLNVKLLVKTYFLK